MSARVRSLLVALILLASGAAASEARAQTPDTSLYKRMGGYDVIAAVVDDFFARFDKDPDLTPFLGGLNAAAGGRIRQHFVDFFCARTGGPCLYNGRDMNAAHSGLRIRKPHFDAVLRHFDAALDTQQVGAREKREIMTMLRALESEIVQG